jgi:hypothetical protein
MRTFMEDNFSTIFQVFLPEAISRPVIAVMVNEPPMSCRPQRNLKITPAEKQSGTVGCVLRTNLWRFILL